MSKSQEWGSSNSKSQSDKEVEEYLEKQASNPLINVRRAADEGDRKGSKLVDWVEKLIKE